MSIAASHHALNNKQNWLVSCIHSVFPVQYIVALNKTSPASAGTLLLVTGEVPPGTSTRQLQNQLEDKCAQQYPVSVLVFSSGRFSAWLSQQHPFAAWVAANGNVWYPLDTVLPAPFHNWQQSFASAAEDCRANALVKVRECIAGAEWFTSQGSNGLAAFMCHQAAERALVALFQVATGLRVNSHNIERLFRLCTILYPRLLRYLTACPGFLPGCFLSFRSAYLDSRYAANYQISRHQLSGMQALVKGLYTQLGCKKQVQDNA